MRWERWTYAILTICRLRAVGITRFQACPYAIAIGIGGDTASNHGCESIKLEITVGGKFGRSRVRNELAVAVLSWYYTIIDLRCQKTYVGKPDLGSDGILAAEKCEESEEGSAEVDAC